MDDVVGQLDGVDELPRGFEAVTVDEFEQQSHQVDFIDAGGLDISRLGGDAMEEVIEPLLRDSAEGDQVISQAATPFGKAVKGIGHVFFRDFPRKNQQIS